VGGYVALAPGMDWGPLSFWRCFALLMVVICRWRLPERASAPIRAFHFGSRPFCRNFAAVLQEATIPDLCAGGRFFVLRLAGLCRRFPGDFHGSVSCERTHVWRHLCGVVRGFIGSNQINVLLLPQIFQRADFSRRLWVECPAASLF